MNVHKTNTYTGYDIKVRLESFHDKIWLTILKMIGNFNICQYMHAMSELIQDIDWTCIHVIKKTQISDNLLPQKSRLWLYWIEGWGWNNNNNPPSPPAHSYIRLRNFLRRNVVYISYSSGTTSSIFGLW